MSDAAPVNPLVTPPPEPTEAAAAQPLLRLAVGASGWVGARRTWWVAWPLTVLLATPYLIPTALALGAGYGLAIHPQAFAAVGLLVCLEVGGLGVGGMIGLVRGLIRRARGTTGPGRWEAVGNRPIRLIPWRRGAGGAAGGLPRPRRWWARWEVWVLAPALVVLTVALGLGVAAGRFVDRRLSAAIAAADRDDPDWRLDDLIASRPAIPDDRNSALVVAEVVARLPAGWPPRAETAPGVTAPVPGPLLQALERNSSSLSPARLDDQAVTAIRAGLADLADALDLARPLADAGPGRHDLEIANNPISTPLAATQASRDVARLLLADAEVRAATGEIDAALDSSRAILGVARSIGDEPFLISGLVRIGITELGLHAVRRVLSQGEATDNALTQLQADLERDRLDPFLLAEVRGERAMFDALITRIRDGDLPIAALQSAGVTSDATTRLIGLATTTDQAGGRIAPWGRLWFDHQRAVALEWMNQLVFIAHQAPAERPSLSRVWAAELQRVKNDKVELYTAALPLLLMTGLDRTTAAHSRYQAELGAMLTLVAAERYRLKTRTWPESLAAIEPDLLPDPPTDPFTGKLYLLERPAGQFSVHSVGPNLRDEHGAYEPKRLLQGGPDDFGTGAWDVPLRRQAPANPGSEQIDQ